MSKPKRDRPAEGSTAIWVLAPGKLPQPLGRGRADGAKWWTREGDGAWQPIETLELGHQQTNGGAT